MRSFPSSRRIGRSGSGLGALSCDLIVAVMVTSLLRVRLGYRVWRTTHWLAYASWPLALVHSLGTGSDARSSWLPPLAFVCIGAVIVSVLARLYRAAGDLAVRGMVAGAALVLPVAAFLWYQAARASPAGRPRPAPPAPAQLLEQDHSTYATGAANDDRATAGLPSSFSGRLTGALTESASDCAGPRHASHRHRGWRRGQGNAAPRIARARDRRRRGRHDLERGRVCGERNACLRGQHHRA